MQKLSNSGTTWRLGSPLSKVMRTGWIRNSVATLPPEKMVGVTLVPRFPILADDVRHNRRVDTCPEVVEDVYEKLEGFSHSQSTRSQTDAFNVLSGVRAKHAGWLSRTIRENIVKEREKARDEIESELNARFPPPHPPPLRD